MRAPRLADLIRLIFADEWFWLAVYLVTAAVASVVCIERRCNNFLIFRAAFDHLRAGADLYMAHPVEHADLFKYSPTFALLFAPFAKAPFALSIAAWNVVSALLLFLGLRQSMPAEERIAAIQLGGLALILTIDGTQTNAVIAALILLSFAALERDRIGLAALAIATGAFIKLFPAAAVSFAFPRRDRWRFGVLFACSIGALALLPLGVTSMRALVDQYGSWYAMGSVDALDRGASVMRLLHEAGYAGPNWPVQLAGTLLLLLPLARGAWKDASHRRTFLGSVLVYCVIFNHKAEHPSFIIALAGVAVWYANGSRTIGKSLATALLLASVVPVFILVAVPGAGVGLALEIAGAACTVAWLTMQAELLDLAPVTDATLAGPEMQPAD
jgi:hypothetical protein